MLFLPQFWLFPIYRELLNTASRNRPSKNSEVRRAASGLVKVICTAQDCSAGKKGSRKGKPLTSSRQWCPSRATSNCDLKQGGLFLPLVSVASQHPDAPRRIGKASPSVSIFARDPLCKNTCRYCRCRPCDVAVDDDHTCYGCEQRLLHREGVPGAPWQPPLTPGCESWCTQCTSQRCAVRGLHELHVCMGCERAMTFSTPVRGGDSWLYAW